MPDRDLWLTGEQQKQQEPQIEMQLNNNNIITELLKSSKLYSLICRDEENNGELENNFRLLDYKRLKELGENRCRFLESIVQHCLK